MKAQKIRSSIEALLPDLAEVARERRGLAELASALLQLRARTGQTQAEFAAAADVPKTLISELENVRNDGVAWRTIVRLAAGAGASLDIRFALDATHAGDVDVSVIGEYCGSQIDIDEVAALIDDRNQADARLGYLAA